MTLLWLGGDSESFVGEENALAPDSSWQRLSYHIIATGRKACLHLAPVHLFSSYCILRRLSCGSWSMTDTTRRTAAPTIRVAVATSCRPLLPQSPPFPRIPPFSSHLQ